MTGRKVSPQTEFHRTVRACALDTVKVFRDDKYIRKMLKKGKYGKIASYVLNLSPPNFIDPVLADQLVTLNVAWAEIKQTKSQSDLTWPKGIKVSEA
jgi:hypothetical protein